MDGKWEVRDIKDVYASDSIKLQTADVELPDKSTLTWDVVTPIVEFGTALTLTTVKDKGTLMIWRHRFITDTWTWELPSADVAQRETAKKTAERAVLEATGWQVSNARPLIKFQPLNDRVQLDVHVFVADNAEFTGAGRDTLNAGDLAWLTKKDLLALIEKGDVSDGPSLTAVLYALSKNLIS